MAIFRQIQTSFWQDTFILDLTPEEKYFYLYLMTNSRTTACGVYELPSKIIEMETGYNRETIEKLLKRFIEYGKIDYDFSTKEIFLKNWLKNNSNYLKSPATLACIKKELKSLKTVCFIEIINTFLDPHQTPSIPPKDPSGDTGYMIQDNIYKYNENLKKFEFHENYSQNYEPDEIIIHKDGYDKIKAWQTSCLKDDDWLSSVLTDYCADAYGQNRTPTEHTRKILKFIINRNKGIFEKKNNKTVPFPSKNKPPEPDVSKNPAYKVRTPEELKEIYK